MTLFMKGVSDQCKNAKMQKCKFSAFFLPENFAVPGECSIFVPREINPIEQHRSG